MIFKPHDYQLHCINRIIEIKSWVSGLIWVKGLGKTVTTLTAIKELKYNRFQVRRVLVIAPKKVAEGTWTREAAKWDHTKMLRVSPVLGSQSEAGSEGRSEQRRPGTSTSPTAKMWCGWWIITGTPGLLTWWWWMRAAVLRATALNASRR